MRLNKIIQRDYTSFSLYYQIKLPLDLEISIPSDDPVRLVSAFVEEMDLSELYKTYGRIRKKSGNAASDAETCYLCSNESNLLKPGYQEGMETGYYEKPGPVIHETNFFCG